MRILYVTRQFNRSGYYVLEHLLNAGLDVAAVVVPPVTATHGRLDWLNRPALSWLEKVRYRSEVAYFRGQKLRFDKSVLRLARNAGVPALELSTLQNPEAAEIFRGISPDLLVVGGGWPELIPPEVLRIARLGAINTHPSLLPEFRGTDVHRWQVLSGVGTSGVTVHFMDEAFDTGGILGRVEIALDGSETPQEVFERSARAAGPLVIETINRLAASAPDRASSLAQVHRNDPAKYFSKWPWDDDEFLRIDWRRSAIAIERLVRAAAQEAYCYRGPVFSACGVHYILRRASVVETSTAQEPGEIMVRGAEVFVGTGDSKKAIRLDIVQPVAGGLRYGRALGGRRFGSRVLHSGCRILDGNLGGATDAKR